ncbi:MAG: APH(3') family aminoglycoside O-phosphotransferase [Nocardioidaceae bacterium]
MVDCVAVEAWEPVTRGATRAEVRRSRDGAAYAKTARDPLTRAELEAERDRVAWLADTGFPGPSVLDWVEDGAAATLVTTAVPGVPASDLPRACVGDALPRLAGLLRDLHALPVDRCPFDRRLAVTVEAAQQAAASGSIDLDDLDPDRRGRAPADLIAEVMAGRSRAAAAEVADLVVCHGDACLPNLLLDPDTLAPTGVVDLGRLGTADRYLDLALITRSMSTTDLNPQYGAEAAAALLAAYGVAEPDAFRLTYYRLLDEFW